MKPQSGKYSASKPILPRFVSPSSHKHSHSTILRIAFNYRPLYYLLVVIYLLSISNPDTYICDATVSPNNNNNNKGLDSGSAMNHNTSSSSGSSSSSSSNSISCTLLLREHYHHLNMDIAAQPSITLSEHSHGDRYHPYYHYKYHSSLRGQLSDSYHALRSWYGSHSLWSLWNAIPSKWKMTALSIALLDIGFLIVIKTLVFEDNYAI